MYNRLIGELSSRNQTKLVEYKSSEAVGVSSVAERVFDEQLV